MRMRAALFLTGVLLMATNASACPGCSAGALRCLPGFWMLSVESGAAIFLLAAFIERPFIGWAGVRDNTLAHSLVATALTVVPISVGGAAVLTLGWEARSELLLIAWLPGSVLLSAAIKRAWLNRRSSVWRGTIRFWPILMGGVTSAVVVALLPLLQMPFGFDRRLHAASMDDFRGPAALLTTLSAIVIVVMAATRASRDRVSATPPHGFDVVPLNKR